ncbi:hypothetical protein B0H13DRAFT_126001 [Mycena leptocephala]|nr:hypothetical protein B0H13DRAFT_126001 [Mycena leptocephala]
MSLARRKLWRCPVENCYHQFYGESASQVAEHVDDFHARGYSVKIRYEKTGVTKYRGVLQPTGKLEFLMPSDIQIRRIRDLLPCFGACARTSHSMQTLRDHLQRQHFERFQVINYSVSEGPIIPDPAISLAQSKPSPVSQPAIRRIDFTTFAPTLSRSQRPIGNALKIGPSPNLSVVPASGEGSQGLLTARSLNTLPHFKQEQSRTPIPL